jgi:hypothetical protein
MCSAIKIYAQISIFKHVFIGSMLIKHQADLIIGLCNYNSYRTHKYIDFLTPFE